jgi:dUTP pyrophosphatase
LFIEYKKLHPDAVEPSKANRDDSGFDLVAVDDGRIDDKYGFIEYRTGISVALPPNYEMVIRPRSSISKYDLVLCNSPATIDNGYRGEILLRFKPAWRIVDEPTGGVVSEDSEYPVLYKKGDKIAQAIVQKVTENVRFIVGNVEENTDRGAGGFGSTGV